ncbi:MAG: hypothetical protein P4L46_15505 [Fimbriimonas sp.]|nr:hypothetical protein [Fimbriimonas sp.]
MRVRLSPVGGAGYGGLASACRKHWREIVCCLGWAPLSFGMVQNVAPTSEDDYLTGAVSDPVVALQARIYTGSLKLAYEPKQGFLRAILHELKIAPSSQILVFSKTSLQTAYIAAATPRAVYFNDRTYVGWIKDAPNIEIASVDPKRGPIFYTVRNTPRPRPNFIRQTMDCLQCHESSMTNHVPGLAARSVFAGADGLPRLANGSYSTTYRSPFKERWGGWYVTGKHGEMRHMGNEPATGGDTDSKIDTDRGANVTDLRPYIDVDSYLTPHSDIVSLMVAELQMDVQNLITKTSFLARDALRDESIFSPDEFKSGKLTPNTIGRIQHACEPLIQSLLCIDEFRLTSPVTGTSGFEAEYSESAPKDRKGRSLSQLDLKSRLLRYRCSPMIYSTAIDSLPKEAKAQVFHRLAEILTGKDVSAPYDQLTAADRQAILEILKDTKPAFADAL